MKLFDAHDHPLTEPYPTAPVPEHVHEFLGGTKSDEFERYLWIVTGWERAELDECCHAEPPRNGMWHTPEDGYVAWWQTYDLIARQWTAPRLTWIRMSEVCVW